MIGKLLGGTFGYVQAGIVGLLALGALWLWRDYTSAKEQVTTLESQVAVLEGQVESKDGVIASMGRTAGRRDAQSQKSEGLGHEILQAKDGTACARSEPIRIALDGLRETAAGAPVDDSDADVPVLAGAYPAGPE